MSTSAEGLGRGVLTRRYLLAMLIIGTVLLGQQGLLSLQAGKHKSDGALINDSGLQRMLSQRIAMLANDAVNSRGDRLRDERMDSLDRALGRMESIRSRLQEDWQRRAADGESDFSALLGDDGIASRIDEFLSMGRFVLERVARSDAERSGVRDTALTLSENARGDFLDALDEVVTLYELRNRESVARLQWAGTLAILIGLLVLLAVSTLIFRPMVDVVVDSIDSLRDSRDEQFELGRRMSHDLRSPIASSLGVLSIVEEALEEGDVDEAKEAAGRLGGALARLDNVLARLMAVTRLHRVKLRPEPVDVGALLAQTVDAQAAYARVTVEDGLDGPILTDRALLQGILQALIDNAIVYRRGDRADIAVSITQARAEVTLSITDHGIGIPEQCRGRVFDMFQQFHPDRSSGTGLGLYLAKVSARTLCGQLGYQPLAEGSRFTLTLPDRLSGSKPLRAHGSLPAKGLSA